MTDIQGGAGGEGGGQGGGAAADAIANGGAGGGDGGQGSGTGAASWRDELPEAIRSAPELANYADIPAAMQGLIESKKAATARIEGYRTDDGLRQLGQALRPADAAEYEIPTFDEGGQPMAEAFRKFAHETGMPAQWTKGVAEFFNQQLAAAVTAQEQASAAEVDGLKQAIGAEKFNANLDAVRQMLKTSGVELGAEDMAALDSKLGSKNLLTFMFDMAARVGEPEPVQGAGNAGGGQMGAMTPEQADKRWNELVQDASWREKVKVQGSPEYRENARLQALIVQGRRAKPS